MTWLALPQIKWVVPFPLLLAIAPLIWLFFRKTWRELDDESFAYRRALHDRGEIDYRPLAALTLAALILTLHEYYGTWAFYHDSIQPWLGAHEKRHPEGVVNMERYDETYLRLWWVATRLAGYLLPLAVWRLLFRRDSLLDFGLRPRGFRAHAWIYALCVAVMIPLLLIVQRQPDFGSYYPMYKLAGRSWFDFALWETIYVAQFLGLEIFFRGWWIRATRVFGVGAIWSMAVPYCMIHYGKPYLEACAAIVAGVVLGSLSMKTRSIYAGFLVHGTVAILMDILSLDHRHGLPVLLAPWSTRRIVFLYWHAVIWVAWILALAIVAFKLWRLWRARLAGAAAASAS
jgi:membrane protease YdiL (CAAX protease family)